MVRTLPLRLAPIAGEALDSWLEATAHNHGVTWAELRTALGAALPATVYPDTWLGGLTDEQAGTISVATGIDASALRATTLEGYPPIVAGYDPQTGRTAASYPWRHTHASRFCPFCLAANGGRWKLVWRMVWFFACPTHRCLLADRCPECGAAQRGRSLASVVPQPGRCAAPAGPDPSGRPPRCGADLTQACVTPLDENGRVLAAQAIVANAIIVGHAEFGIYQHATTPVSQLLADLRALGECFHSDLDPRVLQTWVPAELVSEYVALPGPARHRDGRIADRASPAVGTAIAVTAAMTVVGQPNIQTAADTLDSIWPRGHRRLVLQNINTLRRRGATTSLALRAVGLTAMEPELGVPDQLRCRLGEALPRRPTNDMATAGLMATRIPTMLWPQWSLRLTESRSFQRFLRPALSVGLLLVGNDIKVQDALDLLDCPTSEPGVLAALRQLTDSPDWPDIRQALYRLADYLRVQEVPIDYQRRRQLNFDGLLPQAAWERICRRTRTRPEGCATARQYLLERLSGRTVFPSPLPEDQQGQYANLLRFPIRLTPALGDALTHCSLQFLAAHGARDEPDQWFPPLDLLDGLNLPGVATATVDVNELHRLVNLHRHDRLSQSGILQHLGISADVFRQACEEHPAPRDPRKPPTPTVTARRPGPAYQKASSVLTPQRFHDLYETEGRSLRGIGATVGVSKATITQLARDYGITIRRDRRGKYAMDPEWLRDQHITHRRSLSQIGRGCGVSTAFIVNLARQHGIPVRGPSRWSTTALSANKAIPRILIPALITQGGWERLQRLPVIAECESLAAAETVVGARHAVLGVQVSLIERISVDPCWHGPPNTRRTDSLSSARRSSLRCRHCKPGADRCPSRTVRMRGRPIDGVSIPKTQTRFLAEIPRAPGRSKRNPVGAGEAGDHLPRQIHAPGNGGKAQLLRQVQVHQNRFGQNPGR
jgi:TniQ